jgi:hypothetical protein
MSQTHRFEIDTQALAKDLVALGNQAPIIMARAVNRAAVSGKTAMVRAVKASTGFTTKYIEREIVLDKATRTSPVVAMTIKGSRIPRIAFKARGPEPSRGKGRGVSYIGPGGARVRNAHAFIASVEARKRGEKSPGFIGPVLGHRGVFVRTGKARLPIVELTAPPLPYMFETKLDIFRAAASESLLKNLASEITFAKTKQGQQTLPEFPLQPVR